MDFPQSESYDGRLRHSGFGVASFVLAMGVLLMAIFVGGTFGYYELIKGNFPEKDAVIGSLYFVLLVVNLYLILGLALGIVGLMQQQRKRVYAVLGAIINCFFAFSMVILSLFIVRVL